MGDATPRTKSLDGRQVDVAIIGGGISGIGAAVEILRQGLGEPLILERADELGGTWRDNTYPGCACDIPTVLYSYSFAPNPDWSRVFAPGPEIQRYVLDVVERHGIRDHASLGTEVHDARWNAGAQRWTVSTSRGVVEAGHLIVAAGPLHEPVWPDVPGQDTFAGESFHSSRWRHDLDLRGRRVAVVGTGASAAQFVPEIQPDVDQLVVIQRTPAWVLPRPDRPVTAVERALYRRVPAVQQALRSLAQFAFDLVIEGARRPGLTRRLAHPVARWNIRRGVDDPATVEALTPDYVLGCKRALMSNTYYPALGQPNVTLVNDSLAEVVADGVIDGAGTHHEVDTIIYATGFHVTDLPVADRLVGADGRTLADVWDGHPVAYKGTSVAGFPNASIMFGPNVGTANAFTMLEAQVGYITDGLRQQRANGWGAVDVRPDVVRRWEARIDAGLDGTVWTAGGCTSYYQDETGRNASAWPWTMARLERELNGFPAEDYHCTPAVERRPGDEVAR